MVRWVPLRPGSTGHAWRSWIGCGGGEWSPRLDMDCVECQELMQRYLDREPAVLERAGLAEHFSICPDCRDWHAAAQRLLDGLRLLPPPQPPTALSERISRQIAPERVRPSPLRRVLATSPLAPGFFL